MIWRRVKRWRVIWAILGFAISLIGCATHRPPAPVAAPKYPLFMKPDVPADLQAPPAVRQHFEDGWLRLQAGDLRGASRDFSDALKQSPSFYPAEAGLGYAALADRDFKPSAAHFSAALATNSRYVPALAGQAEAALGVGDDAATVAALEQWLRVEPSRDEVRSRLDLFTLRSFQAQMAAGTKARGAGRLDEAHAIFERVLHASPSSAVILRELALVEWAQGALPSAEERARKAIDLDSSDAESLAVLGGVLEAQGRAREAADAFARAAVIDPRPAWREKSAALIARANLEALPADYRAIPGAATVTRAQAAAMIGIELQALVARTPRQAAVVATDVRTQWAAPWILPVTQAGIMDVMPNHTFQPNTQVRRSELAQIVSQLLNLVAPGRPDDAAKWRAARPAFADVPAAHVAYRAIAAAVTAGAMKLDETGRFWPARAASGADLVAAIARIKQLAPREGR